MTFFTEADRHIGKAIFKRHIGKCVCVCVCRRTTLSLVRPCGGLLKFLVPRNNSSGLWLLFVKAFHHGMSTSVCTGSGKSPQFYVNNCLRQGCSRAPVLFNLYFALVVEGGGTRQVWRSVSHTGTTSMATFWIGRCETISRIQFQIWSSPMTQHSDSPFHFLHGRLIIWPFCQFY